MPAVKRRALVSPEPRPPHPRKARGYEHLSLRPSLRSYREGRCPSSSESDADAVDTDVELGTSLSALDDQLDASGDSGTDVESSLVLDEREVKFQDVKGKGVDPREYGPLSRKRVTERAPYRRQLERRRLARPRRTTRARVVSTESIVAITRCMDGLATSPSDSDDERFVSSSLPHIHGAPTSPIYAPRSPSPASSSSSDSDGYEPDSPLGKKSRAANGRRIQLIKRKAKSQPALRKRWQVDGDSKSKRSSKRSLSSLAAWASLEGYKLVPKSPKHEVDFDNQTSTPVRTVLFPDATGPSSVFKATTPEPSVSEKRPAEPVLGAAWDGDVLLATASEGEDDVPTPTPSPRKRARSQPAASLDGHTNDSRPVRRRLHPVPRRHSHRATPQRTPSRDTSNLHRTSPTSLLPRREKHVRRSFGSRSARSKDAQERRNHRLACGRGRFVNDERAVDGATHIAVLRGVKVTQRVRASLLKRYQQREHAVAGVQPFTSSLPSSNLSPSDSLGATSRPRRGSCIEDEQVEVLTPDDVEMRDDGAVDDVLGDCPPPIVGQKRLPKFSDAHISARQRSAATQNAEVITSYLASRRAYNLARAEQTKANAEEKRERRAELTARIVASQAAQQAAEVAAEVEGQHRVAEQLAQASEEVETSTVEAVVTAEPAEQAQRTTPLFDEVQIERESRARDRRERVARRRAADRVDHIGPHPSRRLIERQARRRPTPARAVRAPSAQPERVHLPAQPERSERAQSAQPDTVMHVSPRSRALSVGARVEPIPSPVATSIPSTPEDQPPQYEFPFFPVVQIGQPTPTRPTRRYSESNVTPPRYVPNTYSRRTPSPPPPYNAQSEGDTQTLMPPVFLLDPDQTGGDWPRRAAPAPAPDRPTGLGLNLGLPGGYGLETEEVIYDDTPPEPVQRWYEPGEEEQDAEQATEETGRLGAIGRWLGLW